MSFKWIILNTILIAGLVCGLDYAAWELGKTVSKPNHSAVLASDASGQCEKPDGRGEYNVKANSGCDAKLSEVEGFLMKNGTVCVVPSTQKAGDYGNWHCYIKAAL
jgi:hypothetical protein